MDVGELVGRVGPILLFVVAITVVAEVANTAGVFATVARAAARLGRGSVRSLWFCTVLVAVLATVVLSLDTTAVLLTPVVLALAVQLDLDRELFAYTAVWLANTASLLLPVSNLTNLLALGRLPGYGAAHFAALTWPAALACVVVTVAALALLFRRSLAGRYVLPPAGPVTDRRLLVVASVVCGLLGPAFLLVDVVVAATVGAGVLVLACAVLRPSLLAPGLIPWRLVLGVGALFVLVQYAHDQGLLDVLARVSGAGDGWTALLRLAGTGAAGANLVDNLPSYLALEPAADGSGLRLVVLLIGVNAGPLITPWASLATLLWAARCRSAGVPVSWRRFALRGLVLVPVLLVTASWLTA